jgi:uncharacterized membrane protein
MTGAPRRGAFVAAATLIGFGMGGFLDGIVLHQILQWHHMLSGWIPVNDLVSSKVNMTWDGLFHALTWLTTLVGIIWLWRTPRGSAATLVGSLALGWGLFNGIEGVIDHEILGVHHVHPGAAQLPWDIGFLIFGVILIVGGAGAVRSGRRSGLRYDP